MRIISGEFKGRRFSPPKNIDARPTTDLAKESLFNVLNNKIDFEETHALDLFAGIGSITLELASRGCPSVTSLEISAKHIAFINKVIGELKVDTISVIRTDVFKFIDSCKAHYDLIFADPPYAHPDLVKLPDLVFKNKLLKEDGLFVLEHPKMISFADHPRFVEHREYGNVNFSFFE